MIHLESSFVTIFTIMTIVTIFAPPKIPFNPYDCPFDFFRHNNFEIFWTFEGNNFDNDWFRFRKRLFSLYNLTLRDKLLSEKIKISIAPRSILLTIYLYFFLDFTMFNLNSSSKNLDRGRRISRSKPFNLFSLNARCNIRCDPLKIIKYRVIIIFEGFLWCFSSNSSHKRYPLTTET